MSGAGPDPHGVVSDRSEAGGTDGDVRHGMDTRSQPRQARLRPPAYHRSLTHSAGSGPLPREAPRASGCRNRVDAVDVRPVALALLLPLVLAAPGGPAAAVGAETASASVAQAEPGWKWPVDGPRVVVRPFVAPPTPYGAGHRGVDLAVVAAGAEVRAVTSGVVHFAGTVVDRPVITVRAGQVLATVEPVSPLVSEGDLVTAGQLIGTLEPGHCDRPCVHLGVRVAGEYVSPLLYLGGLQRAVLLPLD